MIDLSGFNVEHVHVFIKVLVGEIEANLLERFPEGDMLSAFKSLMQHFIKA